MGSIFATPINDLALWAPFLRPLSHVWLISSSMIMGILMTILMINEKNVSTVEAREPNLRYGVAKMEAREPNLR